MRIIAFGDIHEYSANVRRIEGLGDACSVIITGDLTNRGGIVQARRIIDYVRQSNPNVYAQAGNFDQREVEDYLIEQGISLHGRACIVEGLGIFGVGGSNTTPFNTPNEFHEEELKSFILQGYQKIKDVSPKLFISHAPPFNTKVDVARGSRHVGSRAVREFIEKYQPEVCVTGHIHEAKGDDLLGRTVIVNPGMLKDGGYVEIIKEDRSLRAVLKQVASIKTPFNSL